MEKHCLLRPSRRQFLASAALFSVMTGSQALAHSFSGRLPWEADAANPPVQVKPGGWVFFTPDEARLMEAIADRFIPADELSIGGREAGCVVYLDRQLAGSYGASSRLYMKGPFLPGLPTQGNQSPYTPADQYRLGLSALMTWLRQNKGGKSFAELSGDEQDDILKQMESGKLALGGKVPAKALFNQMLNDIMTGFFADPVYGGNKDMVAWKMIGFPGARYDYRDFVSKHNQPYPLPPVSIAGTLDWMKG
ncbi:gluconate 2-dehydrogenase subunit 3 family protein [Allorhizobium sp. BGMRC 0089]|uniref:gluconate 2-dehydrogenase subunit 3 family protein n=1 Tax=Allorhizobium sonneratiae TaxID=2934936 RepID=UPI0020339F80|nr:gluconate 2-dehydrogenase subunit 3 family protein [Allorhizobium sonneratiae]MCM2293145.1 gluconate 2-dehydrogenase subunit 3 family protein [Allorhizobium sonneratiae]